MIGLSDMQTGKYWEMTFKQYFNSIFAEKINSYGSAFAIGENWFLTAYHVVGQNPVIFADGRRFRAKPVFSSPFDDICVLESENHGFPPIEIDFRIANIGEKVQTVAFPSTNRWYSIPKRSNGCIVSSRLAAYEVSGLATLNGCSGSPLLADDGKAIGLVSATLKDRKLRKENTICTPLHTFQEELNKYCSGNGQKPDLLKAVVMVLDKN